MTSSHPPRTSGVVRRRLATAVVLLLAASSLVVAALKYDGAPIRDVDLNNGGVWVSNGSKGMLARLNSQVDELDLGLITSTTTEEIFQNAASVQAFDAGGGNAQSVVHVVDTMRGQTEKIALPATYEAVAGSGVVAILDDKSGKAWIRRMDQMDSFDQHTPADFTVSSRGTVALSRSGTALFVDRSKGEVQAWTVDANGTPDRGKTWDFDADAFVDDPALTVVGDTPVVAQEGSVLRPGEDEVELGDGLALQEVGAASDEVYAATPQGLFRLSMGGGDPEKVYGTDTDGAPAAPAVVDGCVHAAWAVSDSDNYARACTDEEIFSAKGASITSTSRLTFRTNRDVVVLNDVVNGNAWMVQKEGMHLVSNWAAVDPRAQSPQKTELSREDESDSDNQPPVAVNDSFGARPGTTVLLPVTLNDKDADGDLLTVSGPPGSVSGANFSVVGNGTQIQATVPPDARGLIAFDYEITDGHASNLPSTATVSLEVVSGNRDRAPELIPRQKNELTVTDGHMATVHVLPAWIDPDGDNLVLNSVSSKDGTVNFRPDGTIEFTDDGNGPGKARIDFVLKGGSKSRKGSVAVTVVSEENARPRAVADRFTGAVGSTILIEPLKNDSDPAGGTMTVPRMVLPDDETAELDLDSQRGVATFRATRHGSYYLEYDAAGSNGRTADPQLIRVDVLPDRDQNLPPIATRDIAVVPPDDSAVVDVLANDTDPDNDVLVLQGIEVPEEYAGLIKASLVEKRFIRVETTRPLGNERPEFDYLLSDGQSDQVRGRVSITPGEAGVNRPPTAREDLVVARAGTVIDIPVLDNDEDPDGDQLTVTQSDLEDGEGTVISEGKVPVIATGSSIRLLVPDDGTEELSLNYGVRDPGQLRHDARLVVSIKPNEAEGNQAPRPRPIVDRTVVGQRIRISVDAFGSDPDGDPVVFAGIDVPPKLGRIGRTGTDWFEYEPFEDGEETGTDSFRIKVADGFGKIGVAQVRIGVAPRSEMNQPPSALNDQIVVKPGLTIRYPVLDNDTDPDGDQLAFVKDQFETAESVKARLVDDSVEITSPDLAGDPEATAVAQYSISDGLGTSSLGLLQVTSRDDAPDHAPIAQDDVPSPDELDGKKAGDTIDVDVLANDGDLDGAKDDLVLDALDSRTATVVDGNLRVKVPRKSDVVPYRITDATDQQSYGFVYLPGTDTMPPTLNTAAVPVDVVAGEEERISLDDIVVVRPGRSPRIARLDQVEASKGDAAARGDEEITFTAASAYHGLASVTFEVLDGEDLNDATALSSQITVPINVLPAKNVDPTLRSAAVRIQAGEEPISLDLTRLGTDANPDDELKYSVAPGQEGVTTSVQSNGMLALGADADATGGEQDLVVGVTDGKGGRAESRLTVEVIPAPEENETQAAGQGEPFTLSPLSFPDAALGQPVDVDVKKAILSDPDPSGTKRITEAKPISGSASVSSSGTTLVITPRKSGESVVSYVMAAGDGVVARGQVTVIAASTPARPARPKAVGSGAQSVTVSWQAPGANGRPITSYRVSYQGGSTTCPSTTCVIDGLDPGRTYTFTVQAINDVGAGPASPPSNGVIPDKAPGRMAAPQIRSSYADRNGKLRLTWSPPSKQEGSPISSYEFQASPRTSGAAQVDRRAGAGQRSMEWTGLRNGTNYTFKVRAVNGKGKGIGPWSAPSSPQVPFSRPSVMAAPRLTAVNNGGTDMQGYLVVSWPRLGAPANGYDKVSRYDVRLFRNGKAFTRVRVDGSATSRAFKVTNGQRWSATVRAVNRAGRSGWSGRSAAQITWDRASAVSNLRVGAHCYNMDYCKSHTSSPYYARSKFRTPRQNGGFPVVGYEYRTDSGTYYRSSTSTTKRDVPVSMKTRFKGVQAPGKPSLKVRVYPLTRIPGKSELVRGAPATAGGFYPWGRPLRPTKAYQSKHRVTFNCNKGNGRNAVIDKLQQSPGAAVTVTKGNRGCSRITYVWKTIPKGGRRCATVRVKNRYAVGVKRTLCTLRNS